MARCWWRLCSGAPGFFARAPYSIVSAISSCRLIGPKRDRATPLCPTGSINFAKARILVPAGTDEATAIRRAYAGAVKPAAIHGTETRIVRNPVAAHDAVGALDAADLPRIANENFVLSTNLIALAINDDEVIALHPTGSLTHMTTLLWRIAQLFGGGCRVSDAMASLKTFDGCDEHQFLRAVDFLARKRLLWCDEESELQAGRAYAALHWDRPAHLRVLFPWKDRSAAGLPSL